MRSEPQAYALLPAGHPLAAADIVDPQALAKEPLHLPPREANPDIYDLILEMLADSGVTAPRLAPPVVTAAATMQDIAAGHGWAIAAGSVGRYPPAGTTTRPLASSPHREVQLEAIWHRNADALAVRALVDQLLRTPELTATS